MTWGVRENIGRDFFFSLFSMPPQIINGWPLRMFKQIVAACEYYMFYRNKITQNKKMGSMKANDCF